MTLFKSTDGIVAHLTLKANSYLRLERDNKVNVVFLWGKARVALLEQNTISQLELTDAILAVRVDRMLQKELQLKLEK